ncbi:Crp/Fnr family transcriptional regulator [Bdellovibrio bacteriovorus]|uniref:Crp/Fnr family transcriptional regulator n=1 Tax=Bdellovibrio bacteriovorus TaxID=959 RepID=UPI0021D344D2|nr:Crp/Fnr family transcriptional regulator [Bdellovibrio bacteriovorus]UXR65015.1 Crp/Fnr family transcriptional regulator [Bdellovibrio bacteriovorus]
MEFKALFSQAPLKTFKRGDVIYRSGDTPKNIYFVESGLVGLGLWGESGKDHLVRLFREGQIFGHRSLFANEVYHATATVIDEAQVRILNKAEMREQMKGNCDLAEKLLETLAKELRQAEARQLVLSEKDAPARIAEAVVYLKELHPEYSWTRQEIAEFCGTTTPTVIRTLARFVEEGLVEQKGREIVILNKSALLSQG